MDLNELRAKIDRTDDEILSLFIERMEFCADVAKYKKANNLEILQSDRERELLNRIANQTPKDMRFEALEFYNKILEISKSYQSRF